MQKHITVKSIIDIITYTDDMDVILFDLDDTLYSEIDNVKECITHVTETHGCPELRDEIFEEFKAGWNYIIRFTDKKEFDNEKKRAWIKTYLSTRPFLTPYDGVTEMLSGLLKSGKRLGIITDGRPEGQAAKLDALGIAHYFEKIIITDALGGEEFRKPSTKAFTIMQEYFGVPFEKMMYVGDNPERDIEPPLHLGMRAVLFDNDDGIYKLHRKH